MNFTRTLRAVGGAMVVGALLFGTAPVASADQIRHDQWPLRSFSERGAGPADSPYDEREHGTAMASLVAGHGRGPGGSAGVKGLAPDAKILPVGIELGDGDAPDLERDEGPYADALSDGAPEAPAKSKGSAGEYEFKGNKVAIISTAGGVVVLLIVILVIVLVTVKKKRRNGPPPGGIRGYGGPGGPGAPGGFLPQPPGGFAPQPPGGFVPQPPGPYQQQPGAPGTYPPGPYQQQPGAPASFPPAPPTPPSGR
ncbi:S8 family serine peptidase [Streptomyces sioyaensis]|uniref:S8 family serine peptidase n=1 Tax=Streptomyces sioyaensis TaxID=67364 RepID=UPI0033C8D7C2